MPPFVVQYVLHYVFVVRIEQFLQMSLPSKPEDAIPGTTTM
jgi:hypothetical protein